MLLRLVLAIVGAFASVGLLFHGGPFTALGWIIAASVAVLAASIIWLGIGDRRAKDEDAFRWGLYGVGILGVLALALFVVATCS